MKITSGTHWFGALLLFVASLLLLFTTISAPIINHLGLLRVDLTNGTGTTHSSVRFGTFGYCVLDVGSSGNQGNDYCTRRHIGYDPADIMASIDHTSFSEIAGGTSDSLTRVMVLHPIACGIAFIAFLVSLGAGVVGSLIGAFVAFVAWVLTLISLATDFSLFGIIRHHVNRDGSGSRAHFGSAIWLLLAAFVCLFLGMIMVFFTCCSAHREKKRAAAASKNEQQNDLGVPVRKKRFGIF